MCGCKYENVDFRYDNYIVQWLYKMHFGIYITF